MLEVGEHLLAFKAAPRNCHFVLILVVPVDKSSMSTITLCLKIWIWLASVFIFHPSLTGYCSPAWKALT